MKIQIPQGWRYAAQPVDWKETKIHDLKIMIDERGCWHYLERTV